MTLRVDLGPKFGLHVAYVYKDDISSSQVAERLLKSARASQIIKKEDYRKTTHQLSMHLADAINS